MPLFRFPVDYAIIIFNNFASIIAFPGDTMKRSAVDFKKKNMCFSGSIYGILLGAFFCVLADAVATYYGHIMRIRFFVPLLLLACAALAFVGRKSLRALKWIFVSFLSVLLVSAAITAAVWFAFVKNAGYRSLNEMDKAGLFANRDVMLIVPHEDDDLNLLGGAIEEYKAYGSSLKVVFTTNGDTGGKGEARIREAIKVLTSLGVPEEDIIFLGYADNMSNEQGYFYNISDPDVQMYSAYGNNSTYGIPGHQAYKEGTKYTRRNFTQDLKNCILEYRPDTIMCVDFDSHIDHRSTSMIFEEVMGEILREQRDYTPYVLKAFAYSTAYYADPDFFRSVNILSTVNLSGSDIMKENGIYRWSERLRIPVSGQSLSRSLLNSRLYKSIRTYKTQLIQYQSVGIINGDKVFWLRDTSSVLYSADISVNSESVPSLHDFRLSYDSVLQDSAKHTDGVWVYDDSYAGACISVSLAQPEDISLLRLYDSPSPEDNILSARVVFENGGTYEIGALEPNGSASDLEVDEKDVRSFEIYITAVEGSRPGLTEIEAYRSKPKTNMAYIKLTDVDGNFVYDYVAGETEETCFGLYACGADSVLSDDRYTVSCSNDTCSVKIENGYIHLSRPRHAETIVTVCSKDGQVSDSIFVHDSSWLMRAGMAIEKTAWNVRDFIRIDYKYSAVYKMVSALYHAAAKMIYSDL